MNTRSALPIALAAATILAGNPARAGTIDNLVLYYAFDGTSAGPVTNWAGSPHGTNNGATIDRTGQIGRAYDFGQAGGYVDTGMPALIPATGDFTVLMWVNTTNPHSDQGHLISNNNGQDGRMNLMIQDETLRFFLEDFGEFNSGADIVDGAWHHVGVMRSSNDFAFIIDGSIGASFGSSSENVATDAAWRLGRRVGAFPFQYEGLMDDACVWTKSLLASEVSDIHAAGLAGVPFLPEPGTMSLLVLGSLVALRRRRR